MLSHFSCVWLFATLWTVAFQAPLSMGFFRQEYWSGLPGLPTGDFSHPAIERRSLAFSALQADSLPLNHWEAPLCRVHFVKCWAEWITSWNQDCQEKYQQPQISRWYHSNCRKWRETKKPLDEGERGKTKIMASGPITSWQIDGETVETVTDYFLGLKITVDSDCSH